MPNKKNTATQESNAELRVRYLQFLQYLNEKPVDIRLHGKIDVNGEFLAMQRSGEHFIVNKLQTPTSLIENGVLRSTDTVYVSVPTKQS